MTLYAVTIERTLMVVAESEQEAEQIAYQHELHELGFAFAVEVENEEEVPLWWLDRMPYGSDKTVKGLLQD